MSFVCRSTDSLKVTAETFWSSSYGGSTSPIFGYGRPVNAGIVRSAVTVSAGLTLTVGPRLETDHFPADIVTIPRHVPEEWIKELRGIRFVERRGELDDFYGQE